MSKTALTLVLFLLVSMTGYGQEPAQTKNFYPDGSSEHELEGLTFHLNVPAGLTKDKPGSLIILLHQVGGRAKSVMTVLLPWVSAGYMVCVPQAKGVLWKPEELDAIERIAVHLLEKMPIDPKKVHLMGHDAGALMLPRLAFSDKLKPVSALYVAGGTGSREVPKWARKTQGVLMVADTQGPAADTLLLAELLFLARVRSLEIRRVPNLGQAWPASETPYMLWWTGIQEGRFQYGASRVFDWKDDYDLAVASQKGRKRGGILVYYYDSTKKNEIPAAKKIELGLFFDPEIRGYARQLPTIKWDVSKKKPPFNRVRKTPSIGVISKTGRLRKLLSGKIKAKALRTALKPHVPKAEKKR